jgi:putative hemolysin
MIAIIDIIILILLIIVNGFFSMAEFALVSSRKIKLKQLASQEKTGANAALTLMEDQTSFLSSVQIGITLIGICTGAYGGASFSPILEPLFATIPLIGAYSSAISLIFIILIITYFSIVIGELVPKRIGLSNPEGIACTVAPIFLFITRILAPFSYLTSGLTHIMVKILGVSHISSPDVIEEEIHLLLEEGTESGVIDETEQDLVESVFVFGDSRIVDLMVPRPEIIAIDIDEPLYKTIEIMKKSSHSRYPVYKETLDSIVGIVSVRDIWAYSPMNQDIELSRVMQDIVVVPNQITAMDLIRRFRNATSPLAVIIDEYGSVVGLITLHDLLEALVGDLSGVDQEEKNPQVTHRQDGSWLVDGRLSPEELKELTGIDCTDESTKGIFRTMAGFLLYETGRVPSEGDSVSWNGYVFKIVDKDWHRIDKILISIDKESVKNNAE